MREREKKQRFFFDSLLSFLSPLLYHRSLFFSLHSNNDESRLSRLGAGTSNTAPKCATKAGERGLPSAEYRHAFFPSIGFFFPAQIDGNSLLFPFLPRSPPPSSRVSCTPLSDNLAILQAVAPTPASKRASKASPATPAAIPAAAPTRRSALASTLSLAVAVGAAAMLPAGPAAAKGAS